MESVNFFKSQMKNSGKAKKEDLKSKSIKISGSIFEKIQAISIKSGMNPTAITNMVLADFVTKVLSTGEQNETKKPYHNPEFDPDDEPFEGVI